MSGEAQRSQVRWQCKVYTSVDPIERVSCKGRVSVLYLEASGNPGQKTQKKGRKDKDEIKCKVCSSLLKEMTILLIAPLQNNFVNTGHFLTYKKVAKQLKSPFFVPHASFSNGILHNHDSIFKNRRLTFTHIIN